MDTSSLLLVFVVGSIIGSFINVIALRYNTGLSIYKGRSKCFHCNKTLKWFELFPILSFLFLRGKCRTCHSKISLQYPLVEILTGFIFVAVALRQYYLWPVYSGFSNGLFFSVLFFVYYSFVFSLLLVIAIYDAKHKIIPDKLVYLFIFLSLFKLGLFIYCKYSILYVSHINSMELLNLLSPLLLFTPFALLWFISDGKWIGFGDAKLAFGIGALLGFTSGLSAIILSFWMGAVWGILMILKGKFTIDPKKKLKMSSEVPFAPFMILGTIISFFCQLDILSINSIFTFLNN